MHFQAPQLFLWLLLKYHINSAWVCFEGNKLSQKECYRKLGFLETFLQRMHAYVILSSCMGVITCSRYMLYSETPNLPLFRWRRLKTSKMRLSTFLSELQRPGGGYYQVLGGIAIRVYDREGHSELTAYYYLNKILYYYHCRTQYYIYIVLHCVHGWLDNMLFLMNI